MQLHQLPHLGELEQLHEAKKQAVPRRAALRMKGEFHDSFLDLFAR